MGLELSRLEKIQLVLFDVDGVLTDCRIWMGTDGEWKRFFSIRDGYGIRLLIENGLQTGIITGSQSKDIQARARSLGIHHFYEGRVDKIPAFEEILQKTGLHEKDVAYIGDDVFDIPILKRVGFAATVPDAMESVKAISHYTTSRPAGNGAVREICDFILLHRKKEREVSL